MTIYFVQSENGKTLCGPFTKVEDAKYALENYTDTFWYGKCSIMEKEIRWRIEQCLENFLK